MRLVLVGGGGHASDILGLYEDASARSGVGHPVIGIVDDAEIDLRRFAGRGISLLGAVDDVATLGATHYLLAVGWPATRRALLARVAGCDVAATIAIHPEAAIGSGVDLGAGSVVLGGARISPKASVGSHACLSAGVLIGHDCQIGDFASVLPGAAVSGDTRLGEGCVIGTNAAVIEGVSIGAWAVVGAGAVVTRDVAPGTTVVGVPAAPR